MYAVFEDGSRQYRVSKGDVVQVDYREAEVGVQLEFNRVILYKKDDNTQVGQPLVDGARVLGEVVDHPSEKLYIQHFRRRKNYRRLRGHRQWYTAVLIKHLLLAGEEPLPDQEEEPPPPDTSAEEQGEEEGSEETEEEGEEEEEDEEQEEGEEQQPQS